MTLIDVLRRAEIEVVVASVEGRRMLTCARGTRLTADGMLVDLLAQPFDLIVFPGGEAGSQHLSAHQPLRQMLVEQGRAGRIFAAIDQAPALRMVTGIGEDMRSLLKKGSTKTTVGASVPAKPSKHSTSRLTDWTLSQARSLLQET